MEGQTERKITKIILYGIPGEMPKSPAFLAMRKNIKPGTNRVTTAPIVLMLPDGEPHVDNTAEV